MCLPTNIDSAIACVRHYYPNYQKNAIPLVAGSLCGLAAIEMAVRALKDIKVINETDDISHVDIPPKKNQARRELWPNLAGVLFYGICASNVVPFTPVIGAVTLLAQSFFNPTMEKYWTLGTCGKILRWGEANIVKPMAKNLLTPLLGTIKALFDTVFGSRENLGQDKAQEPVGGKFPLIIKDHPAHPLWYANAILIPLIYFRPKIVSEAVKIFNFAVQYLH